VGRVPTTFSSFDGIKIAYQQWGSDTSPEAPDPSTVTDRAALAFRSFADAMGGDRLALAAQATAAFGQHIPFERITAPTLVLDGDSDLLAKRPEVLAAKIADARLQLVPGDHLGAVADPGCASAIVEFLNP
jgi:pimeloyl-ACP methyl ester carboxylesterase